MPPKCYQTLENGQRCSALAIHGSRYCRHHDSQLPPKPAKEELSELETLTLPPLIDKPSVLAALNEVVQALAEGRIKRSAAETLLSSLKFAARLITEITEAGETILPAASYVQHRPVDLAASVDRPKAAAPFNPALRYPASQPGDDPSTARLVRELMAQSHDLARSQAKI